MRNQYKLWRVSNGWLLVPEEHDSVINVSNSHKIVVFKTLKEFADFKPKRERKSRTKPTTEPQHTKD